MVDKKIKSNPTLSNKKINQGDDPKEEKNLGPFFRFLVFLTANYDDILGILLIALGIMTTLGLIIPAFSGGILSGWISFLKHYFGWGVIWIIIGLLALGIWLIRLRKPSIILSETNSPPLTNSNKQTDFFKSAKPINRKKVKWGKIFALELSAFASIALLSIIGGTSIVRAESGLDGGIIGWGLAALAGLILQPLGFTGKIWLGLIFFMILLWGIVYGSGLWGKFSQKVTVGEVPRNPEITKKSVIKEEKPKEKTDITKKIPRTSPPLPEKPLAPIPSDQIIDEKQPDEDDPYVRDERLPGLSILSNEETNRPDEKTINLTAGQIVKTLGEFGIPAEVIGYRIGPTVTQFAVKPGFIEKEKSQNEGDLQRLKVRVAQISALEKDLSLALAAERLRIEAPVPGRPYVGIEVPNTRTTAVRLRPILESKNFYKYATLSLAISIGRDVSGAPVIADLAKMPHLLIAGTTGSGKSVCIAALAVCLAMNNLPESLRLIMIDPKMVELQRFKGLPHILGKVETELDRILVVLKWVVSEMERRYKLLEVLNARNIDSYNKKITQKKGQEPLPKMVVFIDELADLMMSAPEETEHNLVRLAQMARAVGIHLVVATQRPSTEIVTGLIKANFPARIAFNVASSIDSRVILDTVGADHLLGKGDMLFLPPEASAPIRLQGVITTDQEIEHLIAYWLKKQSGQPTPLQSPWETMVEEDVVSDRDELIERAIEILRGTKRASTSMLQRRLRIGFPRAARLMEELEEMGVVGPAQSGGRDREVIIDQ